jgi:hypothetical protein
MDHLVGGPQMRGRAARVMGQQAAPCKCVGKNLPNYDTNLCTKCGHNLKGLLPK